MSCSDLYQNARRIYKEQDYDGAIQLFQEVISQFPDSDEARYAIAMITNAQNEKEEIERRERAERIKKLSEELKSPRTAIKYISKAIFNIGLFTILGAIGIFVYQCFIWLKTGLWKSIYLQSLIDFPPNSWFANPDSWYGVHKAIIYFLDLGASFNCFIIGMLLFYVSMRVKS
jgi:tetratricopeptide (TPR) repeat protein